MVPELLAGMDIRDMNLDRQRVGALDRVAQRDGGVGIGAGIDDDARAGKPGLLDEGDELALVIGLAEDQLDAGLARLGLAAAPRRPASVTAP